MQNEEDQQLFAQALSELQPKRVKRSWPFKSMQTGEYVRYDTKQEYCHALAAAYQIGYTKKWRFTGKWHEERNYGVIGRAE